VYASTSYVKRMSLWQSLTYIHNQYNLPWSFIGVLILLQGYLLKNFQLGQIVIILFTYLLEEEPRGWNWFFVYHDSRKSATVFTVNMPATCLLLRLNFPSKPAILNSSLTNKKVWSSESC
jgi:hypothetical protein